MEVPPVKVIAFHLPQFHTFPENDEWWGKGFTEWTNTKKSVPLFKGHYEPREPLNDNYYCLLDREAMKWQIDLAKEYGIYGFCYYHYWFGDGKLLMEKPVEMFLEDPSLDINFCISWANETWSRRWNGSDQDYLIKQDYGDRSVWEKHFYYLLPFFKDKRYIYVDGKPLFVLYKPEIFPEYKEMFRMWNDLAVQNGLKGLSFGVQGAIWNNIEDVDDEMVDLRILYEPGFTTSQRHAKKGLRYGAVSTALKLNRKIRKISVDMVSYEEVCRNIVRRKVFSPKLVPGFFVGWDNTPRKGTNGASFIGSDPKTFYKYFTRLVKKTREEYNKDMIFINAWNEWAEGCYLEPDKKYEYGYLEAVRQALIENGEFGQES